MSATAMLAFEELSVSKAWPICQAESFFARRGKRQGGLSGCALVSSTLQPLLFGSLKGDSRSERSSPNRNGGQELVWRL